MHPNHEDQIPRLNKIAGQIRGIRKMIEDRRYCMDITSQTKAVRAAVRKVELGIVETHIQHCVKEAMKSQDPLEVQEKVQEIMKLINQKS